MKLNPAKGTFGITSCKLLGYLVTKRGIEADPRQIKVVANIPSPKSVKEVQKNIGHLAAPNRFISKYSDKSYHFCNTIKKEKTFVWTPKCEVALSELKVYPSSPLLLRNPFQVKIYLFIYMFLLTL